MAAPTSRDRSQRTDVKHKDRQAPSGPDLQELDSRLRGNDKKGAGMTVKQKTGRRVRLPVTYNLNAKVPTAILHKNSEPAGGGAPLQY